MEDVRVIGIDTDSSGFNCVLIGMKEKKVERSFLSDPKGLRNFKKWYESMKCPLIALEGKNGYNLVLERFLRKEDIQFCSFSASQVYNAREAYLGQHKTNPNDSEGVAMLALNCYLKGNLEDYQQIWYQKDELRDLTRYYEYKTRQKSEETNRLWKRIRYSSQALYILLCGKNPEGPNTQVQLGQGIINLLAQNPDVSTWHEIKDEELKKILNTRHRKYDWVKLLKQVSKETNSTSPIQQELLKLSAEQVLLLMKQQTELKKALEEFSDDKRVSPLMKMKGVGIICATGIVAEIIDIKRFKDNNKLASYSGLGRRSYMTGDNNREIRSLSYNKRLKNYFMTAAKGFVKYNPDKHLSGYCRNLIKKGMKVTEARKRVARAMVRDIYRTLKEIAYEEIKGTEEVAKDRSQNGNIPSCTFSSSNINYKPFGKKIKRKKQIIP